MRNNTPSSSPEAEKKRPSRAPAKAASRAGASEASEGAKKTRAPRPSGQRRSESQRKQTQEAETQETLFEEPEVAASEAGLKNVSEETTAVVESTSVTKAEAEADGPRSAFEVFDFDPELLQIMESKGIVKPNPIQTEIFPLSLKGKDVLASVPPGNGKTAIFLLTAAQRLLTKEIARGTSKSPSVLVLLSDKDSALKTQSHSNRLLGALGIKSTAIFENGDLQRQHGTLKNGVDILFSTPVRALEFIEQEALSLSNTALLICDELDDMFKKGFASQIEEIFKTLSSKDVQKIVFSPAWNDWSKKLEEYMSSPKVITAPEGSETAAAPKQQAQAPRQQVQGQKPQSNQQQQQNQRRPFVPTERPAADRNAADRSAPQAAKQEAGGSDWAYAIPAEQKFELTLGIFKKQNPGFVVIFSNTRTVAEWIAYKLNGNGIAAELVTSVLMPEKKGPLLDAIRSGEVKAIVATDAAARDLVFDGISHVVHFDVAQDSNAYTIRNDLLKKSNGKGVAISFICEDYGYNMATVEQGLERQVPVRKIPQDLFGTKDVSDYPFDEQGRVKSFKSVLAKFAPKVEEKPATEKPVRAEIADNEIVETRSAETRSERPEKRFGAEPIQRDDRGDGRRFDRERGERHERDRDRDRGQQRHEDPRQRPQHGQPRHGEARPDFKQGQPQQSQSRGAYQPGQRSSQPQFDDRRSKREDRHDERARETAEATRAAARAAAERKKSSIPIKHLLEPEKGNLFSAAAETIETAIDFVQNHVLDAIEKKAPTIAKWFERLKAGRK